jgi:biotin carboxyl carrier protein
MPGRIVTVNVSAGQKIARGDVLVTLEAMKMEAAVRADVDAAVSEIVVKPGAQMRVLLVPLRYFLQQLQWLVDRT